MDIKKIISKLPTGYVDDVAGHSTKALKEEIVKAETAIRTTTKEREEDEKLQGAKDLVRDFSAGYNDAIKAQRAKIAYVLHLLDERGVAVDVDTE